MCNNQNEKKVTIHNQEDVCLKDRNNLVAYIAQLGLTVATETLKVGQEAEGSVAHSRDGYVVGKVSRTRDGYTLYAETGRLQLMGPILSVEIKATTLGAATTAAMRALEEAVQPKGFFEWLFS